MQVKSINHNKQRDNIACERIQNGAEASLLASVPFFAFIGNVELGEMKGTK